MKVCKYYNKHMETLLEYFAAIYKLDGCGCGGLLHVLLDDDNYDLYTIEWTLKQCEAEENKDKEEAPLGALICRELMKLSTIERAVLFALFNGETISCPLEDDEENCKCSITEDEYYTTVVGIDQAFLEEKNNPTDHCESCTVSFDEVVE